MVVTIEWMRESFQRFNHDYFGESLPIPAFSLSRGRSRLGIFSCKSVKTFGIGKPKGCKITLSTYYDMTERQVCNVLLHEMIHYYIAYHGLRSERPHGVAFLSMANTLNSKYGWNITVSSSTKGWKVSETSVKRADSNLLFYVLATETVRNDYFLSVVSPSYVRRLNGCLKKVREIRHYAWYVSQDPFFIDFPKVRSLRGRRVSRDIYLEKTKSSRPLIL